MKRFFVGVFGMAVAILTMTQLGCGVAVDRDAPSQENASAANRVSSKSYRVELELGAWRSQRTTTSSKTEVTPSPVVQR